MDSSEYIWSNWMSQNLKNNVLSAVLESRGGGTQEGE